MRNHLSRLEIDDSNIVFIFKIYINFAGSVSGKKFGCSSELYRVFNLPRLGINVRLKGNQAVAVSSADQYAIGAGIIDDAIGIRLRCNRAEDGIGLEIKYNDRAIPAAIGDEPAIKSRDESYPVGLVWPGYRRGSCRTYCQ